MKPNHFLLFPIVVLGSISLAWSQEPGPALPPTTAPTDRQRHVAQLPRGFQRLEVEGRVFFVHPSDAEWVTAAVEQATPPTLPSTMPADLIEHLQTHRESIKRRIMRDVAPRDPAEIDQYFDERLKPFLQRMDEMRPPIIYLVVTPARLREIMKAGWTDPRFHYNRVADDVSFSTVMNLSLDDEGDEMVIPLLYDGDVAPEDRHKRIAAEMHATESGILQAVSQRSQAMSLAGFVELVSSQALEGIELKPDQQWFGVGVSGVLSARYVAELIGLNEQELLDEMTHDMRGNPIRPATIDLLRPTNLNDLQPNWVGAYADAYRRRSMQVVRTLLQRAGEGSLAGILAAMRANSPADGPSLLRLIQTTTGVDVSREVGPQ